MHQVSCLLHLTFTLAIGILISYLLTYGLALSDAHAIEDRMRNQIADMISAYDLQSAIDRAVKKALRERIEEDS